jgi:hypothetical protein
MARRKRPDTEATPRWVDATFPLSDLVTARLRGNALHPEDAYLQIFIEDGEEAEGGTMRMVGSNTLKKLYVQLGDFLAKLESPEVH